MTTTTTNNVKEKALDLLCGEDDPWTWGGSAAGEYFSFDRNGTGRVSPPLPLPLPSNPHREPTPSPNPDQSPPDQLRRKPTRLVRHRIHVAPHSRTRAAGQNHMAIHCPNNLQHAYRPPIPQKEPLAQGHSTGTALAKLTTPNRRTFSMGAPAHPRLPPQNIQTHHLTRPVHRALASLHQETVSTLRGQGGSLQTTSL